MSNKSSIILLKDQRPDSLFIYQIYDPDLDGPYVEDIGKVIPNPGSIAIDKETGNTYYVDSVDSRYKSTLKPCKIVISSDDEVTKILSYGNDKFFLFFDDRTKYTKLLIDSKLIVFGSNLKEYRLTKTNASGDTEIISVYFDTNGDYRGERIPLTDIGGDTGAKQLTNCHTYLSNLKEGDTVEAEVYDNLGALAIVVQLFTKRATILNDLSSSNDVITSFDATSNQMLGSDFYLYAKQDPKHLAITPRIEYVDGTSEDLVVNNVDCFLYGLENFVPSFPGQKQKIMIKKYLNYKQMSPLATQVGDKRFVVCEKIINVLSNNTIDSIKISVMPIWDNTNSKYYLKYIAYSDKRDKVLDVTKYVTEVTEFNGSKFNQPQSHTFDINLADIFDSTTSVIHRQVAYINLKPYQEFQRYTISDNSDLNPVYGVESSLTRRPILYYDSALEQYFIPSSRFMNKEAFLESYYYNSNPPYDIKESLSAPAPTHFTLRSLEDLNTLVATPIKIEEYTKAFSITKPTNPSMLVDHNVIIEFLQLTKDNEYLILFGAPVDVHVSKTNASSYNTQNN